MSVKFLLVICATVCLAISLEAASLGKTAQAGNSVVQHKLDYEGVQENIRGARQAYDDEGSSEDSDEDDDEEDAEQQHQAAIRQQQAQEQSINDSQEGSDEDDEDAADDDDDDDDYFGRRMKRDVTENASKNEVQENSKPSANEEAHEEEEEDKQKPAIEITPASASTPSTTPGSPNTSVLILIRDAIKKVTELPNTQQVATSAQQYFQLFEHFLQQTIEQVIGDDDDEDEVESTTIVPETEGEKDTAESSTQIPQTVSESMDKESSQEPSTQPQQPEQTNDEQINEIKA